MSDQTATVRTEPFQAIHVRYRGPTDRRGSRLIAKCQARSLTVPWDDALGSGDNYAAAARALCAKLGWGGQWTGAQLPDGAFAFVRHPG